MAQVPLSRLAHGRSGDKGNHANVAVIAYTGAGFAWLHSLSPQRSSSSRSCGQQCSHGKVVLDTDMQYAFTRAVAGHMFKNYDGVLKVDGELGSKKAYDPRSYLALAEAAMAERAKQAVSDLRGNGKTMFAS